MILLVHIIIAVSSLVFTTWLTFKPSRLRLNAAYGLVASTLISGTYLVISTGSNMVQSCLTGLIYLGFVSTGLVVASHKLAREQIDNR